MADQQDTDISTVFVGNLDGRVTEEILFELFLQAGPVKSVCIPVDHRTGRRQRYGFVTFKHKVSVDYCIKLMNGIKLFNCSLNLDIKQKSKSNTQVDSNYNQSYNGEHSLPRISGVEQFRPYSHDYRSGINEQEFHHANFSCHDSFFPGTLQQEMDVRYVQGRNSPYGHRNSPREPFVNDFNTQSYDNALYNNNTPHNGSRMKRIESYHTPDDRYNHREERERPKFSHRRRNTDSHHNERQQRSKRSESRSQPYRRR